MNAPTPIAPVHFYDIRTHAILCGLRGFEHRSTKHSRGVTCHTCVGLLAERPTAIPASAAQDAASP